MHALDHNSGGDRELCPVVYFAHTRRAWRQLRKCQHTIISRMYKGLRRSLIGDERVGGE